MTLYGPAKSANPALVWVLRADYTPYGPEAGTCVDLGEVCPFATLSSRHRPEDIANDPSEAYYDCVLIGEAVWGEDSECTETQWRARAREELAEISNPAATIIRRGRTIRGW